MNACASEQNKLAKLHNMQILLQDYQIEVMVKLLGSYIHEKNIGTVRYCKGVLVSYRTVRVFWYRTIRYHKCGNIVLPFPNNPPRRN